MVSGSRRVHVLCADVSLHVVRDKRLNATGVQQLEAIGYVTTEVVNVTRLFEALTPQGSYEILRLKEPFIFISLPECREITRKLGNSASLLLGIADIDSFLCDAF